MPGLPLPSIVPMPPSSPSGGAGGKGGSISIAVTFPDGQIAILSANTIVKPIYPATSITIGAIVYVPTDTAEMAGIMAEIEAAIQLGQSAVILNSTAAMPATGDFLAAVPNSGPAYAPTDFVVSLAIPAANAAPAKSFRTDGVFLLGTQPCRTKFLNAFTVLLTTPPLAAGSYSLLYSDPRGSVTATGVPPYFTIT